MSTYRSKRGVLVHALLLLSLASLASSAIISFSALLVSPLVRISYQWTLPAPAAQVQINFTSSTNPANFIILGLSTDTQTANGTVLLDPRNPVNASCSFCVVERVAGSLFSFPNDVYNAQMSFLDTTGGRSFSSVIPLTLALYNMPLTVVSPVNGTNFSSTVFFRLIYPSTVVSRTANITCTDPTGAATSIFLVNPSPGTSVTVNVSTNPISVVSSVASSSQTALSTWIEGTHTCAFPYTDGLRRPVYGVAAVSFRIKKFTMPPTLYGPVAGSFYTSHNRIFLIYDLAEAPFPGSVNITLFPASGNAVTLVQGDSWETRQNVSIGSGVPDGTYTAQFCYRDSLFNPPACVSVGSFTVKQATSPVTLTISPGRKGREVALTYTMTEVASTGTAQLLFVQQPSGNTLLTVTIDPTTLSRTATMNVADLASNSFVVSSSLNTVPDGTYNIIFTAQDVYANPPATATATSVSFRNSTLPGYLLEPAPGTVRNTLAIWYQLQDDAVGTPVLTIANSQYVIRLFLSPEVPPSVSFLRVSTAAELQQLPVISFVSNAPGLQPIPDGTYDAFLTYTNGLPGNPSYTTSNSTFTIDTRSNSAVITAPTANSRGRVLQVNYTLFEDAGSVAITITDSTTGTPVASISMVNSYLLAGAQSFFFPGAGILPYSMLSGSNSLADGFYFVSLNVSDSLSNPGNTTTAGPVQIRSSTLPPIIYSPVTGATRLMSFVLGLTDTPAAGTATVTISGVSNTFVSISAVLTLDATVDGNITFTWDGVSNPVSAGTVSAWNGVTVPDGPSYTVTLTYSDAFGNPPASAVMTGLFLRTSTPQPAITSPGPFSSSTAPFNLTYRLLAQPLNNSVYLNFTYKAPVDLSGASLIGNVYTFYLDPPNAARVSYPRSFSLSWATNANPLTAAGFNALTNLPNGIPDGTYDILVSYRDSLGNQPSTSTISSVLLQTATPPPTLFTPASGSRLLTSTPLLFRIPSESSGPASLSITGYTLVSRLTCQVQMTYTFSTDTLTGLQNSTTSFDPLSSTIASKVVSLSPAPCPSTFSSLPNGQYSFTLSYRDFLNNPIASTVSTDVTLNWKTEPAIVTAPSSGSVFSTSGSPPVTVNFTLLSTPKPGSVVVAFSPVPSGVPPTITGSSLQLLINDAQIVVGEPVVFSFSPSSAVSSPFVSQQAPASSTPLTSGAYTVTVTYQDNELPASAASTTTVTDVYVSPNTEPPSIFQPLDGAVRGAQIDVQYRIPSTAQEGSIQLNFTSATSVLTVYVAGTQFGTFILSINKITGAASISPSGQTISATSAPFTSLADGSYTITLRYSDVLGNPPASTSRTGITISTAAQVPVVYSPSTGAVVTSSAPLNITFVIPTGASIATGSATVTLTCTAPNSVTACPSSPITLVLVDPTPGQPVSLVWFTHSDIGTVPQVASASARTLQDGTYTVSISYQDSVALQPGVSTPVTGVLVDAVTQTPTLFTPSSNDYYGATMVVSFRIPDSTATNPVITLRSRVASVASLNITLQTDAVGKTVFFSWPYRVFPYPSQINATIPANKMLDGGRFDVLLAYQDAFENPVAVSTLASDVFVDPTGSPIYRVSVTVSTDYDSLPSNFASTFISEVSAALGTLSSQFKVQSVTRSLPANYPVVTFDVLPRFEELQQASSDVVNNLQNQFDNPSSDLRTSGTFTSKIEASAGLSQTQICLNEQQVIIGCPQAPSESSSDTTKWILVGLGAGLAAVVIVLAVLLHYFDKRRKKAEQERDAERDQVGEEHKKFEKEHAEHLRDMNSGIPLAAIPSSSSLAAKPDVRETNITITMSPSSGTLAPTANTTSTSQPLIA